MKDLIEIVVFALLVGFVWYVGYKSGNPFEDWKELKQQCEQDLPRSKQCIMTYIVEGE